MWSAFKAVRIVLDRIVVNVSPFDTVVESVTDTLNGKDFLDLPLVFTIILDRQSRVICLAW